MVLEDHQHDYVKWQLLVITRVQHDYSGSAGDKAFILKACECGKTKAWDYGSTDSMKDRLMEIKANATI